MTEETTDASPAAVIMAGIPANNAAIYHRLRFSVVNPVVYLQLPAANGPGRRLLILRDIELDRARRFARVDEAACPADFTPQGGLSAIGKRPPPRPRPSACGGPGSAAPSAIARSP